MATVGSHTVPDTAACHLRSLWLDHGPCLCEGRTVLKELCCCACSIASAACEVQNKRTLT